MEGRKPKVRWSFRLRNRRNFANRHVSAGGADRNFMPPFEVRWPRSPDVHKHALPPAPLAAAGRSRRIACSIGIYSAGSSEDLLGLSCEVQVPGLSVRRSSGGSVTRVWVAAGPSSFHFPRFPALIAEFSAASGRAVQMFRRLPACLACCGAVRVYG